MADRVRALFDELCLRWAREADLVVRERGRLDPTLVLLPRDPAREEVPIRLDGLRGDLAARGPALVAEIAPLAAPHDPAGLVFLTGLRLGTADGAAVYVTLGGPPLRRALGFRLVPAGPAGPALLDPADDLPAERFAWLDALVPRPGACQHATRA